MKILLPSLMLALSLMTGTARAKIPQEAPMKLSSPDFSEGGNIPERFTCDGKDITPTLKIDGVLKEAKESRVDRRRSQCAGRQLHPLAYVEYRTHFNRDRGKQASGSRSARSERFREKQI